MPPRPSRLAPTLRVSLVAAAVALAGLVTAASVRADEPPRTAQPTVTGPASVTVQQGHTTTFQLQMTGSGTLDCAIVPPGPPALPWAAVFPEIRAVKSFSSGFISQGGQFNVDFFAGAVVGDTCAASWDGAPDPVIIEATFEAACDAPAQTYDERLLGTVSGAPMLGIQTPRIDFIVTEGNCVPVARDDSYQTDEGTPLIVNAADGVLDNDSDRDNDPLAAGSPVGPGHGSLTLNADGSFTYTPNADFTGEDSFTYQASDGVDSDMATVTIDVLPVDDTPPSISYTLTPASPGDGGWYRTPVTLDWTVADNESTATPTGCVDTTVNTDQAMTAYTCSATSEGGTAGPESVGIGYDATLPTVNPSLAEGTNFPIGASAPTVTPGAVDPDPDSGGPIQPSGLASSSCGSVDTSSVGAKSVICTATDNAGNSRSVTRNYTVTYAFGGFQSPQPKSQQKGGSTIPVKFKLTNFSGTTNYPNLASIRVLMSGPASATAPCTYVAISADYKCNLKVPKTKGTYTLNIQQQVDTASVTLADASAVIGMPNANGISIVVK